MNTFRDDSSSSPGPIFSAGSLLAVSLETVSFISLSRPTRREESDENQDNRSLTSTTHESDVIRGSFSDPKSIESARVHFSRNFPFSSQTAESKGCEFTQRKFRGNEKFRQFCQVNNERSKVNKPNLTSTQLSSASASATRQYQEVQLKVPSLPT